MILAAAVAASMFADVPLPKADKEPRSVDLSTKASDELSACVVNTLVEAQGYEIARKQTETGPLIELRFRVLGVPATAASIYIQELGSQRRLVIYATGKANGAPRHFASRTRECI